MVFLLFRVALSSLNRRSVIGRMVGIYYFSTQVHPIIFPVAFSGQQYDFTEQGSPQFFNCRELRMLNLSVGLRSLLLAGICTAYLPANLFANNNGNNNFVNQRSVGGVAINAEGVLRNQTIDERKELRAAREKALAKAGDAVTKETKQRVISLAKLDAAVKEHVAQNKPLSDDLKYLAGLQRIEFVFVDAEHHDILLAGPGEGWRIANDGTVVGVKSGLPVMHLDDLMVAIRSAEGARRAPITCSIDPTPEGVRRVQTLLSTLREIGNKEQTKTSIEQALGPQMVTVTGVPDNSGMARVLVAADYRMKRLGMKFDTPPVQGLPSYLDLANAGSTGLANAFPRWWLVPKYDAIVRDPEGTTWKFNGSVKCMASEDFMNATGQKQTAKAAPAAQTWADNMTKKYDELAQKEPIFAELKCVMDLAIVGTLITKERLLEKADLKLSTLSDEKAFKTEEFPAPKSIDSQATMVKKGTNWLISASGGVEIQPWAVVSEIKQDASVSLARKNAPVSKSDSWWWD